MKKIMWFCIFLFSSVYGQRANIKIARESKTVWIVGKWPSKRIHIAGKAEFGVYGEGYQFFVNGSYIVGKNESGKWKLIDSGRILRLYDRNFTNVQKKDDPEYLGEMQGIRYINNNQFEAIRALGAIKISYNFYR